jgi:hypothetical protein
MMGLLLFIYVPGIQAQTSQTKLNQVDLLIHFVGSWKCDIGKDTTCFWEARSYGTGIVGNFKYVTEMKTIDEGNQLIGYDKSIDKFIDVELRKGKDVKIFTIGFLSQNKCEIILYHDFPNMRNASIKEELVFKTPDMFVESIIVNEKTLNSYTFTRDSLGSNAGGRAP